MKLLGAMMILLGCGAWGCTVVTAHRRLERALLQLVRALEYMSCELQYRMLPLPALCLGASEACTGCVSGVLGKVHQELEAQITPDAAACMRSAISQFPGLQDRLIRCLLQLGDTLGRFDLQGQLRGLESVRHLVEFELEQLRRNQDVRLRNYQTLGFCAGCALVILFL